MHILTHPKPQHCKAAVAGLLEGQHLPAQPSPQLLPEAEFSGSWRPLSYTKCLKLFPDSRVAVRPCVSQSEISPLQETNCSFAPHFPLFGIHTEAGATGFHPKSQTDSFMLCYSLCVPQNPPTGVEKEAMLWSFCSTF